MTTTNMIKAGLLASALLGLTAPAIAQRGGRDDGGREGRAERGGGDGPRAPREDRQHIERPPTITSAPAPAAVAPPVAAAPAPPPAAMRGGREGNFSGRGPRDEATNPRQQNGPAPRPGTPQWRAEQGVGTPPAQAPRPQQNWANDQGRSNGGGPRGDDHRGDDHRGDDHRGDNGRDNDRGRADNGRGDNDRNGDWNRRDNDREGRDRNWNNGGGYNGRDGNRDGRFGNAPRVQNRWNGFRPWTNDWRRDRRYDWQNYRRDHRDVYRLPRYYAPYGWRYGYSRFSVGIYLNSLLFGQDYWIDDPYDYRLPPAYGTLRWVRYYNDAMLVDVRDGYVVDVIYDFFW